MRALRRDVEIMQLLAVYAECFTSYSIHTRSFRRQVYPINCSGTDIQTPNNQEQEGQHPLTGQRAAKFRLLANQWAECRLVTQWRHGCCPMRRSVCNTGASNAGRSLCIQISRERSYPLPICWHQSKGNWLHYNFATSFFIQWNFAADFSSCIVKIVQKTTNLSTFVKFSSLTGCQNISDTCIFTDMSVYFLVTIILLTVHLCWHNLNSLL